MIFRKRAGVAEGAPDPGQDNGKEPMLMKDDRSRMKAFAARAALPGLVAGLLAAAMAGPQAAPDAAWIEVPVLVEDRGAFVEDLALDDFEILENGVTQIVGRLYAVDRRTVVRSDEREPVLAPYVGQRHYVLVQMTDWDSRVGEAIDALVHSHLQAGDSLTLLTPMKPYIVSRETLASRPKAEISKSLQQALRKDVQIGSSEYRGLIRNLRRLSVSMGGGRTGGFDEDIDTDLSTGDFGLELQIVQYRDALRKLENLRLVDEAKLLGFADSVRAEPGRKFLYFFYQREFRPEISPTALNRLMTLNQENQEIVSSLAELFHFYRRESTLDVDRVNRAFADAGLTVHFIYMSREAQQFPGATMREQSEDIFQAFTTIARATGGLSETAQNPVVSFRKAAARWEKYYLLHYRSTAAEPEPGFRTIDVRVKGRDLRVYNRPGYYAR